jgi:hypothetical protein
MTIAYETVTPLPSETYGSRVVSIDYAHGPVVQVVQRIGTDWHPTPARHYAETLGQGTSPDQRLAIDYGQGWALDSADSLAHYAYAAGELAVYTSGLVDLR